MDQKQNFKNKKSSKENPERTQKHAISKIKIVQISRLQEFPQMQSSKNLPTIRTRSFREFF